MLGGMELPKPDAELLTADEETSLARELEAGLFAAHALATGARPGQASTAELLELVRLGRMAQQRLFTANLAMVVLLARNWAQRTDAGLDDLFQEGCVGLGVAIQRWDYKRGTRFATLAWRLIERAIAGCAWTRAGQRGLSPAQARAAWRVRRAWAELEIELGRSVGVTELAAHLGKDVRVVAGYLAHGRTERLPADVVAVPDDFTEPVPPHWLASLPQADRRLLSARFGIGQPARTLAQLAHEMGTSPSSVRRLEQRALGAARRRLLASGVG